VNWVLDRSPVDMCFDYDGSCLFRREKDEHGSWTPYMKCETCDRRVGHLVTGK
jgi:hypothetical protein